MKVWNKSGISQFPHNTRVTLGIRPDSKDKHSYRMSNVLMIYGLSRLVTHKNKTDTINERLSLGMLVEEKC